MALISILIFLVLGVLGLAGYGIYAAFFMEDQKEYEFWSSVRPEYLDSIKCKYCAHYDPYVGVCRLGSDYDQGLNRDHGYGGVCIKRTPDERCEHFITDALECFLFKPGEKRQDGSYYVNIKDAKK